MASDAGEHGQRRVELLSTVLLACAAVATAFSTYQSTRWRGEQAADYSKGTAARIQSSAAQTRSGQQTQIDIATFVQWVDASVAGKRKVAQFYRRRFRPEFRPAFDAWLATRPATNPNAPLTPFAMPQYVVAEAVKAEQLNREAGVHAAAADQANKKANDYVLAVVLFAASLFFAGVSTKLNSLRQREVLLGIGSAMFLGTLVWMLVLAA
ncbi:MAG: hypothetical protein ACM3QU_06295 [Verrucomicrobiota bacterium]